MPEAIAAPAPAPSPTTAAPPVASPAPSKPSPPTSAKAGDKAPDIITGHESSDPFADAFAEIDKEAGEETVREEKHNKGERAEKPVKPVDDKAKGNGEAKPEDAKPKETEPKTPKELRDVYNSLKEKVAKEYEPQLKELPTLRAKLKELESKDESTTKATQERIAAIEKRNAELEQHMRFVDYEKSTEYRDQFQKPYEDAWGSALRDLKGLTMKLEDPKTGEEIVREVTQADIAYFANLDPAVRRTEINRLFPEDREEVKRHINQISNLAEKAQAAREKAKTDAETHSKTQTEAQRQSQVQRAKLWKSTNEELAAKYPKWFGKDETDTEGNAVFDKGTAFADLVFNPTDLTPDRIAMLPKLFKEAVESSKPFSQEALVKLHAIARNKLANHDRAITKLKAAQGRIAELEKSLKEYEQSGPDAVAAGNGHRAKSGELTADEEFDMLARGN